MIFIGLQTNSRMKRIQIYGAKTTLILIIAKIIGRSLANI